MASYLDKDGLSGFWTEIIKPWFNKFVEKIDGKNLSTNDFTDEYVLNIDNLNSNVEALKNTKVDKISGKGLTTNDFSNEYKNKIDSNESNITLLQSLKLDKTETAKNSEKLGGKEPSEYVLVTNSVKLSDTAPQPLGTESSPGTANDAARGDHVHPIPEIRKVYDRANQNSIELTVSDNGVSIYDSVHNSRLYFNANDGRVIVYDKDTVALNSLYGTSNKPTAEEIGALPEDGTAAAATKLETARTIRTNLASTSTASFNGTANITPGVTGTLPIGNGGTGATTAAAALTKLGAMADYGRGSELWNGSWASGNITVSKTENYNLFKINMEGQGTSVIAVKTGDYIRGIGGYASGAGTITTYHFAATFSGNKWTFVNCLSIGHEPSESHGSATSRTVSTIIGLC